MSTADIDHNHNIQMEELYSKIHDERKCVTTKSLSLEMGITRSEAASLLEALPYFRQDEEAKEKVYDVTRCVWNQVGNQKYGTSRCMLCQLNLINYINEDELNNKWIESQMSSC